MTKKLAITALLLIATTLSAYEHGPDKGTLVIVGGNMSDPAIVKRFIDLAGGPDAPIVIIPTAGDDDDYGNSASDSSKMRPSTSIYCAAIASSTCSK